MKITFMGTGAADWNISTRADNEFFRRFTSVMINDDLMIDCNIETLDFIEKNGNVTSGVKNLLVTHTHSDHYSAEAVDRIVKDGNVWGDAEALEHMGEIGSEKRAMPLYTPIAVGRYTVTAMNANHSVEGSNESPLHYIISDGERSVFWGCDGAWLLNGTWHEIRRHKLALAVFDGTLWDEAGDYRIFEHNNLKMVTEMAATFRKCGVMTENAKIMVSHMSRFSQYPHEKLAEYLKDCEIETAYDGLVLEI